MAKSSNKPATEISEMKLAKGSKLLELKGLSKIWANRDYQHEHKSVQIPINNQTIDFRELILHHAFSGLHGTLQHCFVLQLWESWNLLILRSRKAGLMKLSLFFELNVT